MSGHKATSKDCGYNMQLAEKRELQKIESTEKRLMQLKQKHNEKDATILPGKSFAQAVAPTTPAVTNKPAPPPATTPASENSFNEITMELFGVDINTYMAKARSFRQRYDAATEKKEIFALYIWNCGM